MNRLSYHSAQNSYSNVGFLVKSTFVLLRKCQCIIMTSKEAFKFACFKFCKVCTGLFEPLLSNIIQEF